MDCGFSFGVADVVSISRAIGKFERGGVCTIDLDAGATEADERATSQSLPPRSQAQRPRYRGVWSGRRATGWVDADAGHVDSLKASAAAALALSEAARQRQDSRVT